MIGDSHIAAIKLGWQGAQDAFTSFEPVFFGANGQSLKSLRIEGRGLVADKQPLRKKLRMTSGSTDRIDVDGYDAFILFSLGFGIRPLVNLYRDYRHAGHRDQRGSVTMVSTDCFNATAHDLLADATAFDIHRKLRLLTDRPVILSQQPSPSDAVAARRGGFLSRLRRRAAKRDVWRDLSNNGDGAALAALLGELRAAFQAKELTILDQPDATKSGALYTKSFYSRDSVRLGNDLSEKHDDTDYFHMNARYGAEVLRDLAKKNVFG